MTALAVVIARTPEADRVASLGGALLLLVLLVLLSVAIGRRVELAVLRWQIRRLKAQVARNLGMTVPEVEAMVRAEVARRRIMRDRERDVT